MDRFARNLLRLWLIPLVAAALTCGCSPGERPHVAHRTTARLHPSEYEFVDLDPAAHTYPRELLAQARVDSLGCVRLPLVETAQASPAPVVRGGIGEQNETGISLGSPDVEAPRRAEYAPHIASNYDDLSRLPPVDGDDLACYPEEFQRVRVARVPGGLHGSVEPELADVATRPSAQRFWTIAPSVPPRSVLIPQDEDVQAEAPTAPPAAPPASSRWRNDESLPVVIPADSAATLGEAGQRIATKPKQIENPHVAPMPDPSAQQESPRALPQRDDRSDPRKILPSTLDDSAMRAVSQRAEEMNRHAFIMAQRGAHYSARAELLQTLRMISQALDAREQSKEHSKALAAGLRAMEEASDFLPQGFALESHLNMQVLVDGHKTPVLKGEDLEQLSSVVAAQRYYTFAQQQLALASGQERAGSFALYGLGRLETVAAGDSNANSGGAARAMVYHQAAVSVDPANYKSANELGVLLARFGQYEQARDLLMHSVRVRPTAQSWHNLASVHAKLGDKELARRANNEARLAGRPQANDPDGVVRWVPVDTLASAPRPAASEMVTPPANNGGRPAANNENGRSQNLMDFLPWRR